MRLFKFTALLITALCFIACDNTTDTIGSTITNRVDNLTITDAEFDVTTQSLAAGSVLSKNSTGIIGKLKDPETGTYLTGDYMAQLGVLSSFSLDTLQYIRDAYNGEIMSDSCFIRVTYSKWYGDSLAPMKVTAYEMSKPMPEANYYSDYDAFQAGYVSEDNFHADATYDLTNTGKTFKIYLNKPYTKDGKTYKNYGTYIMNTFVEHPEYFKSNYAFLHNVCPGFYLKYQGGVGSIAKISDTELRFFWKRQKTFTKSDGVTDSIVVETGYNNFNGTEETMQINKVSYDQDKIDALVEDGSCTYLKSPAGIFTVATLPVEEVMKGHENDTLTTATIAFEKINDSTNSEYNFDAPSTVLMVPLDSLQSFFENGNKNDNRTSYTTTYSSKSNASYTYQNISNLITNMYKNKGKTNDWNKVVLIPVSLKTATIDGSSVVTKVNHDMGLTSTRLVRGTTASPIKLKVIYSRFKDN